MHQFFKHTTQPFAWFGIFLFVFLLACKPGEKALENANQRFGLGQYNAAIQEYQKAIEHNTRETYAKLKIAESYRLSNRLPEAASFYQQAIQAGITDSLMRYHYALSLKSQGEYYQAREQFESFLATTDTQNIYTKRAKQELNILDKVDSIKSIETFYDIQNLTSVNTQEAEYAPVVFDGAFYFTSSRNNNNIYETTGYAFTNLFRAPMRGDNILKDRISTLGNDFTNNKINEGCITFSPDGRTLVFAKGNSGKPKGKEEVNLYISTYKRGEWSEPRPMGINKGGSWDSTPVFSRRGNRLYFASNRPGGHGGIDLYVAKRTNTGRFGFVQNMGSQINTPGDEMFPFVSDDGKLYFSSTGHPGLGSLDLFVATRENDSITIKNLGAPINSASDDFSIHLTAYNKGYFCSNRPGGKGNDDIYKFVNNDPDLKEVNYFLAGATYEKNEDGENPILKNVDVKLTNPNGYVLDSMNSGTNGRFKFEVEGGKNYEVKGYKDGYFVTTQPFSTIGKTIPQDELTKKVTDTTFRTRLVMRKIVLNEPIVLEDIYYDFDKAYIRDDAARELDELVKILKNNTHIYIELSSHTDARGDDEYNMKLSQRRAEAAVEYIVDQGIDPERITAKGYGESQLKIPDAETEEEHQVNRRTEFKVTNVKGKPIQKSRIKEESSFTP